MLLATLSAADERSEIRGDRPNKSQSAEMKINDRLTQPSLKSGFEKKKKTEMSFKRKRAPDFVNVKNFVHIYSSDRLQICGIKLGDNVASTHLWEINFAT